MNFNISISSLLIVFTMSCNHSNEPDKKFSEKNGGTLILAENTGIGTLFPHAITAQTEGLITEQIHESLLRLDSKLLEVIPGLAQKWETSPDGKTITFHLIKGAHFQDDKCYNIGKGPEITSKDV